MKKTTDEEQYSPYCPVCSACGEEGCCSATACVQHPDGHYCDSYLRDLKFGYVLSEWVSNNIIDTLPKDTKDRYNQKWDEFYDIFYNTKEE